MLPPASPMAVATRPSMPGWWSISTRRTIEYCAETEGMRVRISRRRVRVACAWVWTAICCGWLRWSCSGRSCRSSTRRSSTSRSRRWRATCDASLSSIQWVSTGYLLALATVIPLTGWSMERFGGKRMWMLSVTLFLVGSTLCGLAWSTDVADRLPRAAGLRRRDDPADRPGDPGPGGRAAADGAGDERDRRADAAGADPRAGHRRPDRRQLLVALDLLREPARSACGGAGRWPARICRGRARHARTPLDVVGLLLLSPGLALLVYGLSELGIEGGVGLKVVGRLVGGLRAADRAFVLCTRRRDGTR